MLKLEAKPQFRALVTVSTAAVKGEFTVIAVALRTSELKALEEQVQKDGTGVSGFLKRVLVSVGGVELPDGPLPGTLDEAIDVLCDYPALGVAMQRAYYRGLWEEQAKN